MTVPSSEVERLLALLNEAERKLGEEQAINRCLTDQLDHANDTITNKGIPVPSNEVERILREYENGDADVALTIEALVELIDKHTTSDKL